MGVYRGYKAAAGGSLLGRDVMRSLWVSTRVLVTGLEPLAPSAPASINTRVRVTFRSTLNPVGQCPLAAVATVGRSLSEAAGREEPRPPGRRQSRLRRGRSQRGVAIASASEFTSSPPAGEGRRRFSGASPSMMRSNGDAHGVAHPGRAKGHGSVTLIIPNSADNPIRRHRKRGK
jgi:hypothetical protein